MIGCLPTQALAFLAVFVYATHATQAIAFEWKPGFSHNTAKKTTETGFISSDRVSFGAVEEAEMHCWSRNWEARLQEWIYFQPFEFFLSPSLSYVKVKIKVNVDLYSASS